MIRAALSGIGQKAAAERLLGTLTVEIDKARELLQWVPTIGVAEALRRTVGTQ